MIKANRKECLEALEKVHEDPEAFSLIESLIKEHFVMIEHMKKTALYDVFMYEERLLEPMKMLVYDNEKLKKEINELRQNKGLGKKYKERLWFQMKIKFAEDIVKEIESRGQIGVPEGCVTGDDYEEWLYEKGDKMKNNVTPLERNEIGQISDVRAKCIEAAIKMQWKIFLRNIMMFFHTILNSLHTEQLLMWHQWKR